MMPPRDMTPALSELLENVDAERDEFRSLGSFDHATQERLRKAFLPEFISDTLNIEGIVVNPRITTAVLDGLVLSDSDKYVEKEIRNVIAAHQIIESLAVLDGPMISVKTMTSINAEIERDLISEAGIVRKRNVAITGSEVVPPEFQLVEGRLDQLASHSAIVETESHPIVHAAWLHREFAEIHPFTDGNGRTALLL